MKEREREEKLKNLPLTAKGKRKTKERKASFNYGGCRLGAWEKNKVLSCREYPKVVQNSVHLYMNGPLSFWLHVSRYNWFPNFIVRNVNSSESILSFLKPLNPNWNGLISHFLQYRHEHGRIRNRSPTRAWATTPTLHPPSTTVWSLFSLPTLRFRCLSSSSPRSHLQHPHFYWVRGWPRSPFLERGTALPCLPRLRPLFWLA